MYGPTECHGSDMREMKQRNQPYFLRRSDTNQTSDSQYVQPLIIPVIFVLCSFAGIAVTSAGIQLYGEVLWDPLLLIDKWDNRAAAFFASFAFALATIGTNISANSLSAGNDMTVLLPKVGCCTICTLAISALARHTVYQHQTWANNLCSHGRLGDVPLGDPGQVSLLYRKDPQTDRTMEQCPKVLELHERVYYFLGSIRGNYGHRCMYSEQ